MPSTPLPLVSLGVPVFNGEKSLARCLDSLLRQDYPNLEIVISDNGSTDGTPDIGERYTRLDSRVRYVRADRNRGLVWNFNRVFELSSGKYFAWTSHDDEREPAFVRMCVDRLEQRHDAALCSGRVAVSIDPSDDVVYIAHFDNVAGQADPVARYRDALTTLPPPAFYGLYRSSAIGKTRLFQRVLGTDLAFLHELVIHGPVVPVPAVLMRYRARPSWNNAVQDARAYLGVDSKPWWYVPFIVLFLDQCSRLMYAPIPAGTRIRLGAVLVRHEGRELARRAVIRLAGALCLERYKERLARTICDRWFRNPNLTVSREDVFFQRVCKPQLHWWP